MQSASGLARLWRMLDGHFVGTGDADDASPVWRSIGKIGCKCQLYDTIAGCTQYRLYSRI